MTDVTEYVIVDNMENDQHNIKISVDDALLYKDAAKELGITTMTLWRWVKSKKIISIQLGRYKFIPRSEIKRLSNV